MSGSVNKVILIGHLGADPTSKSFSGGEVVSFSLATTERWNDRDGNRQQKTEWHKIVIFNENIGKIAMRYLRKGSACYIEGQLQTRKWQDNTQRDCYTTEIVLQRFRGELVLIDPRQAETAAQPPVDRATGDRDDDPPARQPTQGAFDSNLDDDVPF